MTNRGLWVLVVILGIIIVAMAVVLFFVPTSAHAPTVATTTPATTTEQPSTTTQNQPLSARVSIASPASGATVSHTFTVAGKAPGNWFFEAVFPIQVRDANDNVIGRSQGQAQGEWMTTNLVPFTSTITVEPTFTGNATLVLMRDNPSGLPENDDSVSIPIVVQ